MLCFDLLSISRMKEVFFTEKGYACLNTAKGNDDEYRRSFGIFRIYPFRKIRNYIINL